MTTRKDELLEAWYQNDYASLRRIALVMLGDPSDAEDAVMDTFLKAASKWRVFQRLDWPSGYLRKTLINECRSKLRRRRLEHRTVALFRTGREESQADIETHGGRMDVWQAISKLPVSQRACVALRYLEDMTEPDIATALDLPIGTVKSQLSRARRNLQRSLER
jgi:RNA polymerase sigma-70 factor (ECF subfamily)